MLSVKNTYCMIFGVMIFAIFIGVSIASSEQKSGMIRIALYIDSKRGIKETHSTNCFYLLRNGQDLPTVLSTTDTELGISNIVYSYVRQTTTISKEPYSFIGSSSVNKLLDPFPIKVSSSTAMDSWDPIEYSLTADLDGDGADELILFQRSRISVYSQKKHSHIFSFSWRHIQHREFTSNTVRTGNKQVVIVGDDDDCILISDSGIKILEMHDLPEKRIESVSALCDPGSQRITELVVISSGLKEFLNYGGPRLYYISNHDLTGKIKGSIRLLPYESEYWRMHFSAVPGSGEVLGLENVVDNVSSILIANPTQKTYWNRPTQGYSNHFVGLARYNKEPVVIIETDGRLYAIGKPGTNYTWSGADIVSTNKHTFLCTLPQKSPEHTIYSVTLIDDDTPARSATDMAAARFLLVRYREASTSTPSEIIFSVVNARGKTLSSTTVKGYGILNKQIEYLFHKGYHLCYLNLITDKTSNPLQEKGIHLVYWK